MVYGNEIWKNIFKLFDVMQNKLGLGVSVNSEELIKSGIGNRITVLMILDKLYSVFKNNPINGNPHLFIKFKKIKFLKLMF